MNSISHIASVVSEDIRNEIIEIALACGTLVSSIWKIKRLSASKTRAKRKVARSARCCKDKSPPRNPGVVVKTRSYESIKRVRRRLSNEFTSGALLDTYIRHVNYRIRWTTMNNPVRATNQMDEFQGANEMFPRVVSCWKDI